MKYISVLRGINVSGKNKIKMVDLKAAFVKAGFENVVTYIQSGNVIFDYVETDTNKLASIIEKSIGESFGYDIPVDVRTRDEYLKIYKSCPYEECEMEENGTKVLVTLLSEEASNDKKRELQSFAKHPERLSVKGNVVYLYCPNGYGRSKLTNTFIESKLELIATTRNWKTIGKLVELSC